MRSFQASWFKQWSFLHYDEVKDVAYCHICVTAFKQKKKEESRADPVFVRNCTCLAKSNFTCIFLGINRIL